MESKELKNFLPLIIFNNFTYFIIESDDMIINHIVASIKFKMFLIVTHRVFICTL